MVSKEIINNSNSTLYKNVSSDQIQITVDKLRLKLEDFEKSNKRSVDWMTCLGLLITSVAALNSATFNSFLGISGDTWKVIFELTAVGSFLLLLITLICYWFKKISIDDFINDCKKTE